MSFNIALFAVFAHVLDSQLFEFISFSMSVHTSFVILIKKQGWKLGKFSGAAPALAPQSDGAEPAVRADLKEPSRSRSWPWREPSPQNFWEPGSRSWRAGSWGSEPSFGLFILQKSRADLRLKRAEFCGAEPAPELRSAPHFHLCKKKGKIFKLSIVLETIDDTIDSFFLQNYR